MGTAEYLDQTYTKYTSPTGVNLSGQAAGARAEQFVVMQDGLNDTTGATGIRGWTFDAEKLAPIAPAGVRRSADHLSTVGCPEGF